MPILPIGQFLNPIVVMWLIPIGIGVFWVRRDADRLGQPGWLWALLTIPLNWTAIVAYLVVRTLLSGRTHA